MRGGWRKIRDSNGRVWCHPSVTGLIDSEPGTPDPEERIRRAAKNLVNSAKKLGWNGPPYDMKALASLAGLTVKGKRPLPDDVSAMLLGTMVFTNANHAEVRQRYSEAHEIVHTFFPDRDNSPSFSRSSVRDPDWEVEYLCQVGAAELIMPYWCFESTARRHPLSLRTAFVLADLYGVSPEACLRRMVDFANTSAAAVFLVLGRRKAEEAALEVPLLPGFEMVAAVATEKLRIARLPHLSAPMKARRIFFPTNKSIPDNSVCYHALNERRNGRAGIHSCLETWDIHSLGKCQVETVAWLERANSPAGGMALLLQT